MLNGGVIHHECSRSDLSLSNYDTFHEYSAQSPTAEEKWEDWGLLNNAFKFASKTYELPSGISINSNPLSVEVVNNTFEMNLRGSESSLIYLDRTPFFSLRDNIFEANGDILIVGLSASLD